MREILFRGKAIDGNWYYGVPLVFTEDYVCMTEPHTYNKNVEANTVGQYTGLTDKNGKKIFEGDILKATEKSGKTFIYKVVFINGIFGLVVNGGGYACALVLWAGNCIEIIGNIYDNPELLSYN